MAILTKSEIRIILDEIEGWEISESRPEIMRRLKFSDFNEAFSFMTAIALKAESMKHHPAWHHKYNRLDITLTTHDEGGVTAMDISLARFINKVYKGQGLTLD